MSTLQILFTFLAAVVAALGVWGGQRVAARSTEKAAEQVSMQSIVTSLWARIDTLETRDNDKDVRLAVIERELGIERGVRQAMGGFIDHIGQVWQRTQRPARLRPPRAIHDHIDMTLWVDRPYDDGLPAVATPPMEAP